MTTVLSLLILFYDSAYKRIEWKQIPRQTYRSLLQEFIEAKQEVLDADTFSFAKIKIPLKAKQFCSCARGPKYKLKWKARFTGRFFFEIS